MMECRKEDSELDGNAVPNGKKNGAWLRFLAFLSGFCLLLFVLYLTGWIDIFFKKDEARLFLQSLGPFSFLGFILIQAAQVVLAPIPGEVTGILGGYCFGMFCGVVLSTIGLTLGSFIAFALSKKFGRPLVEKLVDKSVLNRFDYLLESKGSFFIFLLFLTPGVPKDYLCFILGLGHLSWLEFLVVSTVGRLLGTIMLTLGGGYLRYEEYGKLVVLVGIATLLCIVAFILRERMEALFRALHQKGAGWKCFGGNGLSPAKINKIDKDSVLPKD
ncbi:MAG: TVP38/TMEM64 family protein [Syntrophobacteraceae bacterium]